MNETILDRRIDFRGCGNFRDIGGYRTKNGGRLPWGRLFRSDTIHGMTANDARRARREIGIKTVVDLRTTSEKKEHGIGLLGLPPVHYVHMSLLRHQGPAQGWEGWRRWTDLSDSYLEMLAGAGPAIAEIIKVLGTRDAMPAVFHCMAGKDRTGVLAAVLLSVLDVDEKEIVEDYSLSDLCSSPALDGLRISNHHGQQPPVPPALLRAAPETMESFLRKAGENYGSLRDFVMAQGVTMDDIFRLQEDLTEQPIHTARGVDN